jgi:uncharacterized membrane protein
MTDSNPKIIDQTVFDAKLVPYRSLSARGLSIILACVGVFSFLVSLPFFFMGAWPVAGFLGLDVFLLYIAFRASSRSARAYEHVVLTHFDMVLRKVSAKGREQTWHFTPVWTRIKLEEHEEFGVQRVLLVQKRREVEIASFLGAEEKAQFATSFKSALLEARRGPTYNY